MEDVLKYKYKNGKREVYPANPIVANWVFTEETEDEAMLAHYMAAVAQKNGLTANDMQHLFPAVLRMLKSKINWAE